MKKLLFLVLISSLCLSPLSAWELPPFWQKPSNNFIIGGVTTALAAGLSSLTHKYHRKMRQLDREMALAMLDKQYANNETEHEIADQRIASTLRRRNTAKKTMLYLLIPSSIFSIAGAGLLTNGFLQL